MKFNCPFSPVQILSSCSQEPWLCYMHILRNCCRLALSASSPWNSWPMRREGERMGVLTGSHGKNWKSYAICASNSNLINGWFLIKTFFPDGTFVLFCFYFCFVLFCFWIMGSVCSSLIPNDYFWSKEGWRHWHTPSGKGPWVSEGLLEPRLRNLVLLISRAGTIMDLQTPSLFQASCQPWGAAAAPYRGHP